MQPIRTARDQQENSNSIIAQVKEWIFTYCVSEIFESEGVIGGIIYILCVPKNAQDDKTNESMTIFEILSFLMINKKKKCLTKLKMSRVCRRLLKKLESDVWINIGLGQQKYHIFMITKHTLLQCEIKN